jgi:hypothetical protein
MRHSDFPEIDLQLVRDALEHDHYREYLRTALEQLSERELLHLVKQALRVYDQKR